MINNNHLHRCNVIRSRTSGNNKIHMTSWNKRFNIVVNVCYKGFKKYPWPSIQPFSIRATPFFILPRSLSRYFLLLCPFRRRECILLSRCPSVGWSTNSFCSFPSQMLHILNSYLVFYTGLINNEMLCTKFGLRW